MIFNIELKKIDLVAHYIKELLPEYKFILLNGEMGSGKTTLVNNIIVSLGGGCVAYSPTFSIVNTYNIDDTTLLHSDLYRINSETELEQTGFYEMIEEADNVFIEWANKFDIERLLNKYLIVDIVKTSIDQRKYTINKNG